jgi:hypothetical protein
MKSIYDLAYETVHEDGTPLTENQENEIAALVQFGKRVLKNAAQQNAHLTGLHCPACTSLNEEIVICARCGTPKTAPQVA